MIVVAKRNANHGIPFIISLSYLVCVVWSGQQGCLDLTKDPSVAADIKASFPAEILLEKVQWPQSIAEGKTIWAGQEDKYYMKVEKAELLSLNIDFLASPAIHVTNATHLQWRFPVRGAAIADVPTKKGVLGTQLDGQLFSDINGVLSLDINACVDPAGLQHPKSILQFTNATVSALAIDWNSTLNNPPNFCVLGIHPQAKAALVSSSTPIASALFAKINVTVAPLLVKAFNAVLKNGFTPLLDEDEEQISDGGVDDYSGTIFLESAADADEGDKIWTDHNAEAIVKASLWHPQRVHATYRALGSYVRRGSQVSKSAPKLVRAREGSDVLAAPLGYSKVATLPGGMSVWAAKPPTGYVALGHIAQTESPSPDAIRVVRRECAQPCDGADIIWTDQCATLKPAPFTLWTISQTVASVPDTFFASNSYNKPSAQQLFCLKQSCIGSDPGTPSQYLKSLEIQPVKSFHKIHSSVGELFQEMTLYRPEPPSGYFLLGDYLQTDFGPPNGRVLAVKDVGGSDVLAEPAGFSKAWDDQHSQSSNSKDGSLWWAHPPTGYVALGSFVQQGSEVYPDLTAQVRVVREECAKRCDNVSRYWADRTGGAKHDGSAWRGTACGNATRVGLPGTFLVGSSHSPPPGLKEVWCLVPECVSTGSWAAWGTCPSAGNWGEWTGEDCLPYKPKMRKRQCDHPAPVASGKYCPGLGIKYVGMCNKTTTVIITTVTASPRYDVWLTVSGALAGIVSTIVTIALVLACCTWCKCCQWYECLRKGCTWMAFDQDSDKSGGREENVMEEMLVGSDDGSEEDSENDT